MHSDHRRHDRLLIARFAADDSHPAQLDEARALVAACAECARLAEDIRLISSAVHHLPAARRPRSFQLSSEQAEQLRGSRLERFLRRLSGPGWGTLRPVAGVALSLGLVMAAIGSLPLGGMMTSQPGAEDRFGAQQPDVARATDFAAPTGEPAAEAPGGGGEAPADVAQPAEDGLSEAYVDALRNQDNGDVAVPSDPTAPEAAAMSGGSLLLYAGLSLAALAMGVLTFVWFARRRYADPLLR